ncbi:hypothetical protein FPV67DRAFT_159312 [Lyophyllum atratum]|nr:hypothetical protein FPV67DRAFT_159312 [Lyophyllum atratum]
MDSPPTLATAQELPSKGKGRAADPTECTPLLTNQSSSHIESLSPASERNRRGLRSRLTLVFLVSLSLCLVFCALLALLAWSYAAKASQISPDDVVRDDLEFRGPDRVDVLNITSSGEIWLNIDARLGLDAGGVVGVNDDPEDSSLMGDLWKSVGRWGVQKLDRVTATLSTVDIMSQSDPSTVLAFVSASPVVIPLTVNPPNNDSWLTPVTVLACVRPNHDTSTWLKFIRDAWSGGSIDVQANVRQAFIQGGSKNESSWRKRVHMKFSNIRTSVHLPIPSLPGLPRPGPRVPFPSAEQLITLTAFAVSSKSDHLAIRARATIIDPAPPNFNLTSPSMPFIISLPPSNPNHAPIPIASISTAPFSLTHPNISMDITGTVLPLPVDATPILSSFLSRYLSKQSNPILISSPLVANYSLETIFPPPNPPPRILRNVTIKDMKIKPGTTFLASGTVYARVVLPKGFNVDLVVSRVLPDVLVFDGEVPDSTDSFPAHPPLPDPIPEKAFGHLRPEKWLPSISTRDEPEEGEGSAYVVTAKIVDVPLEVLPGRQKEFSNFVSKVVFGSEGALAGILGSAAVASKIRGLPLLGHDGEMELSGLPFRGSVRVGKKSR